MRSALPSAVPCEGKARQPLRFLLLVVMTTFTCSFPCQKARKVRLFQCPYFFPPKLYISVGALCLTAVTPLFWGVFGHIPPVLRVRFAAAFPRPNGSSAARNDTPPLLQSDEYGRVNYRCAFHLSL